MNKWIPLLLFFASACSPGQSSKLVGQWVDLTHEFSAETITGRLPTPSRKPPYSNTDKVSITRRITSAP
jgi:hypothetical protein